MADGAYRFHPSGGPFHSQHHPRSHNRATSPHGQRRAFPNDTPSPSRSPLSAAMVHNFGNYGQNGFQNQHMMNGGQNHQRFGGMHGLPKQQHNFHSQHGQHHNNHQHGGQMGHQHNISGGAYQSVTPHLQYGQQDLQNGTHEDDLGEEEKNQYWQEQQEIFQKCEDMSESHQRARTFAQQSKSITFGGPLGAGADEGTVEEKVRNATGQSQSRQAWTELDLGGQGLCALSTSLFKYAFLTRLDLPHNRLRSLPSVIGRLKYLEYLDVSFNLLERLPEEIGMLTNLRTLYICGNRLEELPYSLGYLYKLETIGVFPTPMTDGQKDALLTGGTRELVVHLLENMPAIPPPEDRAWHQFEEVSSEPDQTVDTFKAITYNILCERYAPKVKYGYVPDEFLQWKYRRQMVLDELSTLNADVICLQELDKQSYDEFFRQQLSMNGYKGYFAQKSRAETIGDNAKFVDGCGTFWKDKKYILLDTQHFVLGRKAVERPGAKASADMLNRVWQRDDIATVVFLENRVTGSRLIVANSHVFWDPAFKDVKLIQVAVLLEELNKLAEKYAKHPPASNKKMFRFSSDSDDEEQIEPGPSLEYSSGSQIPTIVCGDYNSGPGSPVYELFTKRQLDANHDDFRGRDYGSLSTGGMSHGFTFKSQNALISNRYITNYTPDFADELDHIFYSSNTLRPIGALGEVDPDYMRRVPGFPNVHFPSDHLALMTEFRVEKQRRTEKVEADFGQQSGGSRRHA